MKKVMSIFVLMLVMVFCDIPTDGFDFAGIGTVAAQAADIQTIDSNEEIIIGKKGKMKIPTSYKKPTYTSSNKKVATINKKGVITTKRLGTTVIKAKYKGKTKKYTITVVPKKTSEVRLSQVIAIGGRDVQIKLISDKYDTSQVKLKAKANDLNISKNAWVKNSSSTKYKEGYVTFYYGSFEIEEEFYIVADEMKLCYYDVYKEDEYSWPTNFPYAGGSLSVDLGGYTDDGQDYEKLYFWSNRKEYKPVVKWDGKTTDEDKITMEAGIHTVSITVGEQTLEQTIEVAYPIAEALKRHDVTGYTGKEKEVLEKVIEIAENPSVIQEGMTDEQKVRAIHDYLVKNARYAMDYMTSEDRTIYTPYGLLINHRGVCQSYTTSFMLLMTALDIPCNMVSGTTVNSAGSIGSHAWNQVLVDGVWYYIDCTWDDPVTGTEQPNISGHERYDYYLSEVLWSNHTIEEVKGMEDISMYYWENFYLVWWR